MIDPEKLINNGKISYINKLSKGDVQYVCATLGLTMPEDVLEAYFKHASSRREISVFEIKLIDSIYKNSEKFAIDSFKTNDSTAHSSFVSLAEKHAALYGKGTPLTFDTLMDTTGKFIEKYLNLPESDTTQSFKNTRLERFIKGDLNVASLPVFDINGETVGMYRQIERGVNIDERSCLIALIPSVEMTREKYEEEAATIMMIAENSGIISHPNIIGKGGVMSHLVSLGVGATVNIESYPTNADCKSFMDVMEKFEDRCAFLIREDRKKMLLPLMLDSHLLAVECAKLCGGDKITVCGGGEKLACMDLGSLEIIKDLVYINLTSSPEYSKKPSNITSIPLCDKTALEARRKDIESVYTTVMHAAACSVCDIDKSALQNAALAALLPIFELAVKGVDRRSIKLSHKINAKSDLELSSIIDTLLALHKVQSEIVIPSDGDEACLDSDKNQLMIFASGISASTEYMPCDHFVGDGKIYVLSGVDANVNETNFETVRKLLDYLFARTSGGKIKSSRVFFNTPLDKALENMQDGTTKIDVRSTQNLLCPILYVLLESDAEINGTYLGQTVKIDTNNGTVNLTEN